MTPITINRNLKIPSPTRPFLADSYFPEQDGGLPLIIFVHGYKGYKDWGAWDLLARKFAAAGFFFVKFNFSHNGTTLEEPTQFNDLEAFGHNNFTLEMLDLDAVISHFEKHPAVDARKIALIGHSRGGGISVIKTFEDSRLQALVTLAGVSHFGYRFPSGDRLKQWEDTGVMHSENKRTHQQMPHYFQFYQDYKANEERFNIQYAAQHQEKPYLIIQGTADEAVKDKEATLLHEWCKTSVLEVLQGANHTFGAAEPWSEETLPADLEKAADLSISFLKKVFTGE